MSIKKIRGKLSLLSKLVEEYNQNKLVIKFLKIVDFTTTVK